MKKNEDNFRDLNDEKKVYEKIFEKIKKFFSVKRNIIILAVVLVIIVVLFLVFRKTNGDKFALNEIYDVYPEEVRELYSNFVNVSCDGDMHLNIKIDGGSVDVGDMDKKDLLDYMFSYLDKNNLLADSIGDSVIKDVSNRLFDKKVNLLNDIKSFSYGDYIYNFSSGKVTRKSQKCEVSDTTYVSHLYGYFTQGNTLSIDIMVGYLKDGTLYTFDDKEMGKYDGDMQKLSTLMQPASYYRVNYTRYDKGIYKLSGIEWKHKS